MTEFLSDDLEDDTTEPFGEVVPVPTEEPEPRSPVLTFTTEASRIEVAGIFPVNTVSLHRKGQYGESSGLDGLFHGD